jgi:Tol biopolymer transport system component
MTAVRVVPVKRLALALVAVACLGVLPSGAQAVVPGPNGPFAFASGRDDGGTAFTDTAAQIWMLSGPGGTPVRLSSGFNTTLHRHPTWSRDRTKIAYAQCTNTSATCNFAGPWHIWVQDLLNGGTPTDITPAAMSGDRPSWSPDGTRIAYSKQTAAARWDIVTVTPTGAGEIPVATQASLLAGGWKQARAQWMPDSQSLVYARESTATDYDLRRVPADGSDLVGSPIDAGTSNDYQPAVSPRGDKICFTRDTGAANLKDVYILPITGGTATPLVATTGDEFECAWSPDQTKVAFGRGGFSNGQIFTRNANGTGESLVTDVAGRFDGNADWTYNPRPTCAARTASVVFNGSVTIPLACSDAVDPPGFLAHHISPAIASGPTNGALGGLASNGSVTYTPNGTFAGTDSFTYTGSDGNSSASPVTVSIDVTPTSPAKASFAGSKSSIRVSRKRRFKFTFHATPGLTGKASFKTVKKVRVSRKNKKRKRRVTLARKSFTVPASGKVTLRIKLSKKNFRILKLNRKLRTRVTITLTNAVGLKSTAKKRITLKAPKRKRRR